MSPARGIPRTGTEEGAADAGKRRDSGAHVSGAFQPEPDSGGQVEPLDHAEHWLERATILQVECEFEIGWEIRQQRSQQRNTLTGTMSQRQATKRGGWPQAHPVTSTSRAPEHRIVQNNGLPVQTKADVDLRQIRTGSCHPRQRRARILQTAPGTTLQAMRDDQWARHSIPFFKEPRVHRLYAISR